MSYTRRTKQNLVSHYVGIFSIVSGGLLFFLIVFLALQNITFPKMTEFGVVGICIIGFGTVLIVVFSRAGWSHSKLTDFVLNQLSLLLVLLGFTKLTLDFAFGQPDKTTLIAVIVIFIGLFLAGMGMKNSDLPSIAE